MGLAAGGLGAAGPRRRSNVRGRRHRQGPALRAPDLPPYRGAAEPAGAARARTATSTTRARQPRLHGGAHVRHDALRARRLGALLRRRDPLALRGRFRRGSSSCRSSSGTTRNAATASSRPATPGSGACSPSPSASTSTCSPTSSGTRSSTRCSALPPPDRVSAEYLAFHESAADCVAMIAVLHFDSVVDGLLRSSRGNIYLPNELNRIGELSDTEQIRLASHSLTLADVPDLRTPAAALTQPRTPHDGPAADRRRVRPAGGGVPGDPRARSGFISRELDELSRQEEDAPVEEVQAGFDRAYAGRHDAFKAALLDARDYVGRLLAGTWRRLGVGRDLQRRRRGDAGGGRRADRRRRPQPRARQSALARHRGRLPRRAARLPRAHRCRRRPGAGKHPAVCGIDRLSRQGQY